MPKLRCITCKKELDVLRPIYGLHINKKGEIEKCRYRVKVNTKGWRMVVGNCVKEVT